MTLPCNNYHFFILNSSVNNGNDTSLDNSNNMPAERKEDKTEGKDDEKFPLTHPPTYHIKIIYLTFKAASQCTKGVVRVTTKSSGSDEKQDGGSMRNYQSSGSGEVRWG